MRVSTSLLSLSEAATRARRDEEEDEEEVTADDEDEEEDGADELLSCDIFDEDNNLRSFSAVPVDTNAVSFEAEAGVLNEA